MTRNGNDYTKWFVFGVADIHKEYKRLLKNGVKFTMEPTKMGEVTITVFDDTCGNLIQ
ncbi:VOC family protein [Desulfosporosinus sp. Sb-LF]|uniref:VOC family protein n=1 Tax=Desulfosporosinus sp. Sb-LF TaxID=2560027 RepID=UPI00249DBA40|nr:VOC family protein [Desulfosporosinus sp. Sb-LF]